MRYTDESEERCPVCQGRGYVRCGCWPGDCICGEDDRDCDHCFGEGWISKDDILDPDFSENAA